ncbi:MAG: hypothetical protein JJT94_12415, partial [Bernardetiaceae bacterium]|nr:hypothetical protein [Bernardetiaceae bacterium]
KEEKEKIEWKVDGLRLGMNLGYAALAVADLDRLRLEFMAEVPLSNVLFIVAEGGYSEMRSFRQGVANPFEYVNTGGFFRFGFDYNILHRLFDRESVFVGARYGQAFYDHRLTYFWDNRYWDLFPLDDRVRYSGRVSDTEMTASWFEITWGVRSNLAREGIFSKIYAGMLFRIRTRLNMGGFEELAPTDLPGLGKTDSRTKLGFGYYMLYEFGGGTKKEKKPNLP